MYPFMIRFTKGNLSLNLNLLGLQNQTGLTDQPDRSDRSASAGANFGCQRVVEVAAGSSRPLGGTDKTWFLYGKNANAQEHTE